MASVPSIVTKYRTLIEGYMKRFSLEYVQDIAELIYKFYFLCFDSKLLNDDEQMTLINLLWHRFHQNKVVNNLIDFALLYRASEHAFSTHEFHQQCCHKGATITIIHNNKDFIFGGYASKSWPTPNGREVKDPNAFLFVIRPHVKVFELAAGSKDGRRAYWCYAGYGPIFGGGSDLYVAKSKKGASMPKTYEFEREVFCGDSNGHIDVKDYEVFSVSLN